jgi:hypothetical protein
MAEIVPRATVTKCEPSPLHGFDVGAQMHEPRNQYANDIYKVRIIKPVNLAASGEGILMEH